MSIIRSNIARQLLAEGGAPRKRFAVGGRDQEDDVAEMMESMGLTGGPSPSEYASMDNEEQLAIDQARFDAGFRTPDYISMGVSDNATDRGFFQRGIDALGTGLQNRRGENIINFLNRSTAPTLRGQLGLGRRGDINYVLEQLQSNKGDPVAIGLTPKQFEIGEKLISAGIKDEFDIRNMTQTQFDDLFPGPKTDEGGDNEPIRRLRAPITEKKEEPKKSEFDDILKFYGARFARGGDVDYADLDFEEQAAVDRGDPGAQMTTQERDEQGYGSGDNLDNMPTLAQIGPTVFGGGPTTNVSGFGLLGRPTPTISKTTQDKITRDILTEEDDMPFGLDALKQGTTGTKGTTGLGFAFTPEAPIAIDKVFGSGLKQRSKMYEDVFKADGGAIRQNYGLGSIVKKAARAVKKVAKSPLGKAALIGGLGFLGAKTGFGGELLTKFKDLSALQKAFLVGGTALSLSPFATEEEDEKLPTVANTDPEIARTLEFYGGPRRFASEGGDIDKEPKNYEKDAEYKGWKKMYEKNPDVGAMHPKHNEYLKFYNAQKKAEGGIMNQEDEMLNLGGNEMDLRGGGFVPLGEYEKKDDVPARLSKNEFVFTADAVRAAGGGSVDRGADIMYKTMKNLENKVA